MNKSIKIAFIAVMIILIVTIIAGYGIGSFFYNLALDPKADKSQIFKASHNKIPQEDDKSGDEGDVVMEDNKWFDSIGYEEDQIQSFDGLALHSYIIPEESSPRRWAIVAHGYSGEATEMSKSAERFYNLGFNILMPDARGHGESEGDYIGMGWHDRLDIVAWVNYIISKEPDSEIILYGVSMGGATVMMASGEDLPDNVKAIIEDCGFTSVKDEFAYQLKALYGLPSFPVINFASMVTKLKAGYNFEEASALKQVAKSVTPTLFIHGGEDTFVPRYMLEPLYETKNGEKEMLLIEGAGHGKAAEVDPERYWSTIEKFVNNYLE